MADPLSITASIIAVASAGIKLSTVLGTYTSTVINADKSIREIAGDLSVASKAISELGILLSEDQDVYLHSATAIDTAREAVDGCDDVFREIQKELDRAIGPEGASNFALRMRRLKWPMVEPKLHVLQSRLERLKNTLVLMLNIVAYARKVNESDTLSTFSGPDAQQRQIERLILMNEQANARFKGLERLLHASRIRPLTPPLESVDEKADQITNIYPSLNSSARPQQTTSPTKPTVSRQSTVVSQASTCVCSSSTLSLNSAKRVDSAHINVDNLDACATHLRKLLGAVEDARSVGTSGGRCDELNEAYQQSMESLSTIFQPDRSRRSTFRRMFPRRPRPG